MLNISFGFSCCISSWWLLVQLRESRLVWEAFLSVLEIPGILSFVRSLSSTLETFFTSGFFPSTIKEFSVYISVCKRCTSGLVVLVKQAGGLGGWSVSMVLQLIVICTAVLQMIRRENVIFCAFVLSAHSMCVTVQCPTLPHTLIYPSLWIWKSENATPHPLLLTLVCTGVDELDSAYSPRASWCSIWNLFWEQAICLCAVVINLLWETLQACLF